MFLLCLLFFPHICGLFRTFSIGIPLFQLCLQIHARTDIYSQIINLLLPSLPCRYLLLRQLFVVFFLNSIISVYRLLPAAPCSANTFFCHSNMCINNSLVCNGVQNCVYPWDENHCKGKHLSFTEICTVGYFG